MFKTKEEAQAFIRKVMGPPRRQLEGQELEHVWLLIKMSTPVRESNNQRTITEEYEIGGKQYHVHYGLENDPVVEEVEKDERF